MLTLKQFIAVSFYILGGAGMLAGGACAMGALPYQGTLPAIVLGAGLIFMGLEIHGKL